MKVKTSPEEKTKKRGGIQPRNRTKYSTAQLNAMESLFLVSQYPDSTTIEELAQSLSVTTERIAIWFQNRRSKFKRQSKDVHMAWMRKQIYNQDSRQNLMNITMTTGQSSPESNHVLSPPEMTTKPEITLDKPKSNLHYVPTTSSEHYNTFYYPGNGNLTSISPPSALNGSSGLHSGSSPSTPTYTSSSNNPLLMSHLLNDASTNSSMVTPSYHPNNYSNSNYNMPYNNYSGYYSQMNSYYSFNQPQSYFQQQSQGV